LVPNSKLIDAPPAGIKLADVVAQANDFDLLVVHTSVPSFDSDVKCIAAMKAANPRLKAGLIGAKVAVKADESLADAPVVDFVCRNEFDFTVKDVADEKPWSEIPGLSFRNAAGGIVHNPDRPVLENMDELPSVIDVYRRDLRIEDYFIGYLKHPYISVYTGRGCKSRCTFCLWPQTVGGHRYRTRSVQNVVDEIAAAKSAFPQVKEFFFDDDTFTDERRECASRSQRSSPRTAMSSASRSTAPSSSAYPVRPGRLWRRQRHGRGRSTHTPSRCPSLRPILERSYLIRR
jgi:radical SAM superfamily enzyme YgiQ (UPF0313 family)